MNAHHTMLAVDGCFSRRQIDYLATRAAQGVGMIVTESSSVHPASGPLGNHIRLWDPRCKTSLKKLADAVHAHNAALVCQITHSGRKHESVYGQMSLLAPSAVEHPSRREIPHAMSVTEIREIVQSFADAAARVADAGCDGVEIHMAHGCLPEQFLSPLVNRRDDEYGGSLANRMRFPLEVARAVRQRVPDHVVGVKLAAEPIGELLTLEDIKEIARCLEREGISYIHASTGGHSGPQAVIPPMGTSMGPLVHLAQNIKNSVRIPIIVSNRIKTPELAEKILAEGHSDLVGMARAFISDPEWAEKAQTGRVEDIRPCIGCMECNHRIHLGASLGCTVNAAVGREKEYRITRARHRKTVAVVGGGPGGMEAARVAALRGHLVHLFEQSPRLGGKLLFASSIPGREEFLELVNWLERQLVKLGVRTHLGRPFSLATLEHTAFDAVVVAVGAAYSPPSSAFATSVPHYNLEAALSLNGGLRGQSALVVDREYQGKGLMLAFKLATLGAKVTLLSEGQPVAQDAEPVTRALYAQRAAERGVRFISFGKVLRFESRDAVLDHEGWEARVPSIDLVAVVEKPIANTDLATRISTLHPDLECSAVGDCYAPRKSVDAIHDALRVASHL